MKSAMVGLVLRITVDFCDLCRIFRPDNKVVVHLEGLSRMSAPLTERNVRVNRLSRQELRARIGDFLDLVATDGGEELHTG